MTSRTPDAIVIGAGPYGLAASAHLRAAGADVHTIGAPMSFWRQHMPKGMLLRSAWGASHIADPRSELTLEAFGQARGTPLQRPIPLDDFIAYGQWFQRQAAPELDQRTVVRVEGTGSGFCAVMDDGEAIESRRVVVAAGIKDFAWRPGEFAQLGDLATHSNVEADLGRFAGRRVAVIGGGQSAIESAALLGESGADVELIMRTHQIHWVGRATRDGVVGRIFFHKSDVGPAVVSQIVARPALLKALPRPLMRRLTRRSIRPGGASWLKDRLAAVRITTGRQVTEVTRANGHVRLRLDDGAVREVDHVLLATGYRVDLQKYRFLAPALVAQVRCFAGQPVLGAGMESSIAGLHFLGAPAVLSFGPIFRFVCGTYFSGASLARAVAGDRARTADRTFPERALEESAS